LAVKTAGEEVQYERRVEIGRQACRIVGVNPRTGKRWRHGRTITRGSGRRLHYPPVISSRKLEISSVREHTLNRVHHRGVGVSRPQLQERPKARRVDLRARVRLALALAVVGFVSCLDAAMFRAAGSVVPAVVSVGAALGLLLVGHR
jgi:hypothetical protein